MGKNQRNFEKMAKEIEQKIELKSPKLDAFVSFFPIEHERDPTMKRLDGIAAEMTIEQRIDFLKKFLGEWRGSLGSHQSKRNKEQEGLRKILGIHGKVVGDGLFFTLTGNKRQFRCWNRVPSILGNDHVDSAGIGLIFEVVGPPDAVKKFLEVVRSYYIDTPAIKRSYPVILPNQSMFWGLGYNIY